MKCPRDEWTLIYDTALRMPQNTGILSGAQIVKLIDQLRTARNPKEMRKTLNSEIAKKKRPGAKGLIRNPNGRPTFASNVQR